MKNIALVLGLALALVSCNKETEEELRIQQLEIWEELGTTPVGDLSISEPVIRVSNANYLSSKSNVTTLTGWITDKYNIRLLEDSGDVVSSTDNFDIEDGTTFEDLRYGFYDVQIVPQNSISLFDQKFYVDGQLENIYHNDDTTTSTVTVGNDYISQILIDSDQDLYTVRLEVRGDDSDNVDSLVGFLDGNPDDFGNYYLNTKGAFKKNSSDDYLYPFQTIYSNIYVKIVITEFKDQLASDRPTFYIGAHDDAVSSLEALKEYTLSYTVNEGNKKINTKVTPIVLTHKTIALN